MANTSSSCTHKYLITLLVVSLIYFQKPEYCDALQTFGFDMHHRFSDKVKSIMGADDLPEKGTLEYYAVMAHRDKVLRGRGLAQNGGDVSQLLTFANGDQTLQIASLGYLHYADVSLGTPSLSFLPALDTGSDLFWVPCDCTSCIRSIRTGSGDVVNFNIYSSNSSSTSKGVSCNSSLCARGCLGSSSDQCSYEVDYVSANTSTSGTLVEDVLHLTTNNHMPKDIDARITFGCGQVQTGLFLDGVVPNGIFGLGIDKTSVPSILSSEGLIANSFSMCFGFDEMGRIKFGDKGSSDQNETPFNLRHPTYVISDLNIDAIFDSGTSFTRLSDPAYTAFCDSFDAQVVHKRRSSDPAHSFEYCYDVRKYNLCMRNALPSNSTQILTIFELYSSNSTEFPTPTLIMKGGGEFNVYDPTLPIFTDGTVTGYCLGVLKSTIPNVNFIGQNFMTGNHIVYDREKRVLGWKASNCEYNSQSLFVLYN
ncbi:hypothetical protein C5167_041665 [Papaver somniferum]|nr:hypothetical protein C5167_041665 [Papaver somniferum]